MGLTAGLSIEISLNMELNRLLLGYGCYDTVDDTNPA